MGAALRRSGSFPQRHLETAPQETPSSTPPGRPACLLPARHRLGVLRKPPFCTTPQQHLFSHHSLSPFFWAGFQISEGFVEQLHRGSPPEVQPQASEVPQSGSQGPPAPHQRGNAGSNPGEECHFPGLSGGGADFSSTHRAAVLFGCMPF